MQLQRLLWVEELQHEVDIRQYDMIGATLHDTPGRRNVAFEVRVRTRLSMHNVPHAIVCLSMGGKGSVRNRLVCKLMMLVWCS